MAYISLYRKYRSQTFEDVIGQEHVVRTVQNAIRAGRIGQGYLFCGSRGTGKTTVARLIAKALNCENGGPTPTPCNVCEACLTITGGSAVDVVEMDAASNRGVDDVEALRDGVKYPPMRLRYKVYIIDEAHQLSAHAKDAFLKTLEEPPPHAVFILATTEAHKIPITIRSRCQMFEFRRGSVPEIRSRLKYVVDSENASIDEAAIDLLARTANGSYRDSLSLLEQVMAYTEGAIKADDIYAVLGMVDEDALLEIGKVVLSRDTAAAFGVADQRLREGRDVRELMKSIAEFFRDVLMLKTAADTRHGDDGRWSELASGFTQDGLVRLIDIFSAGEKELRWNEQHRLALEIALLKAAHWEDAAVATVAARPQLSQVTRQADRGAAPVARPAAPVTTEEPGPKLSESTAPVGVDERPEAAMATDVDAQAVEQAWSKVQFHIQRTMHKPAVAAILKEAHPISASQGLLTLGFYKKYDFHRKRADMEKAVIEEGIAAVIGARLAVKTILIEDEPERGEVKQAVAKPKPPEDHPLLGEVVDAFNGKIVEGGGSPFNDEEE